MPTDLWKPNLRSGVRDKVAAITLLHTRYVHDLKDISDRNNGLHRPLELRHILPKFVPIVPILSKSRPLATHSTLVASHHFIE